MQRGKPRVIRSYKDYSGLENYIFPKIYPNPWPRLNFPVQPSQIHRAQNKSAGIGNTSLKQCEPQMKARMKKCSNKFIIVWTAKKN